MPSSKPVTRDSAAPTYTIWLPDGIRRGSAFALLDRIRQESREESEVRKLDTEQYATRIIASAAYFLPGDLLEFLRGQEYDSDFDRALRYLAEMPDSGVRILATASRN